MKNSCATHYANDNNKIDSNIYRDYTFYYYFHFIDQYNANSIPFNHNIASFFDLFKAFAYKTFSFFNNSMLLKSNTYSCYDFRLTYNRFAYLVFGKARLHFRKVETQTDCLYTLNDRMDTLNAFIKTLNRFASLVFGKAGLLFRKQDTQSDYIDHFNDTMETLNDISDISNDIIDTIYESVIRFNNNIHQYNDNIDTYCRNVSAYIRLYYINIKTN